jgi:hypothetical protein
MRLWPLPEPRHDKRRTAENAFVIPSTKGEEPIALHCAASVCGEWRRRSSCRSRSGPKKKSISVDSKTHFPRSFKLAVFKNARPRWQMINGFCSKRSRAKLSRWSCLVTLQHGRPQRQPSRVKKDMQLRAGMVLIPVHLFGDHRHDRAPADDETNPSTMRSASAHDFRASARLSWYVSTEENKEDGLRRGFDRHRARSLHKLPSSLALQ